VVGLPFAFPSHHERLYEHRGSFSDTCFAAAMLCDKARFTKPTIA